MVEVDAHRLRLLPPGEAMKGEGGLCWWTPLPEPDERTSASEELRDGGEGEMTSVVEGQGHTCTPPDGLESVLKKSRRRRRQSGKEPIAGDEVDMYEDVCEFYTAAVEAVACGARVLLGDREFKETQRRLLEAEREDQEDRTRPRNEKSGEGRVVEARVKRRGLESTPPAVWRKMRDLEKAWGPRKFAVLMTERDQVMSSCLMRLEGNQDIVAVVGAHHMLYWQCRLLFNRRGVDGHVEPEKVVKGLARWLRPLLREMSEKIYGFLMSTGLQLVVEAYLDLLNRASRLGLFFSNDFATEKEFDPRIDSEEKKGLLRAGDTCIVVFPATITPLGIVVSKRFVVATQPPEQLESLRQKMLRSPAATRNGGLDTSWSPGKKPFDAREAIQRDMAEGDTANAAPGDAQSKGSGLPEFTSTSHDELTSHELESLVRDVDGLEETVPRTSDASVAVEGSSQSKSTGPGQEVGGPGSSFEHYAAPDAVRLKEPETHWRMSYPEFVPISARNT
eukprot:g2084.t1